MKTWLLRACDKLIVAPLALAAALVRRPRGGAGGRGAVTAIKLVGMGDAVLMLPALAAIRAAGRRLTVITTGRAAGVFTAPGVADAVVIVGRHPASWWAAVRALRRAEAVLDFEQHVYGSGALVQVARRRSRRFGFQIASRRRNLLYDVLVRPEGQGGAIRHMKDIFDDLARAAGFTPGAELIPLPLAPAATAAAEQWREQHHLAPGRYVVFAPGSGGTVLFRRLAPAVWAAVAAGLPEWPIVVVGAWREAELCRQIAVLAPRVLVATGFSVQELAGVMAGAAGVIANDSGPMHLAAATGVPVVGIFGPDTPRRYGPRNPRSVSVYQALTCSPCNNCWVYREARCTNPEPHVCMSGISAGEIVSAAAACLATRQGAHY
ncbi:MAG TPA: glycosyltransferase family 9 protein [Terriglobales bacterium]|nr:glycosyltransferase family 9 protein [Terriglobales bacterium]